MQNVTINLCAQSERLEQAFFRLDAEKFRQFNALLDAPPEPNPGLERLLAVQAPWDDSESILRL